MKRTLIALALLTVTATSHASQVASAWYFGNWSCVIDHRAARMVWQVVDDPQTSCSGNVCSSSSGVAVRGWFKDGSGPWVKLVNRSASGSDLRFTYTGDNTRWFLRYDPNTGVATGNTIWRGNTYPLQCSQGQG
ncbi:hypothetical protein GCM10022631_22620 [Deinococcus rubellus]|uniref:DUF6006 family protein n=1 Tax=Deinococcus rubellus TaxID=1889240 RepID=A0ABY5YGN5_9DEIO|nr:DUF6006 family protein [Deinococcus rubellus]UWX64245.1 DUF6006 family protein [Deinococcus rubellus]